MIKAKKQIDSYEIKTALMRYFRWQRQFICAEEVGLGGGWADILADTGEQIYEVEVKVSKADLKNESKKRKHNKDWGHKANKFYICVPEYLIKDALKWVNKTDKRYGVIEYRDLYNVYVIKKAKLLHDKYNPEIKDIINRRLSTMVIDFMLKKCEAKELL